MIHFPSSRADVIAALTFASEAICFRVSSVASYTSSSTETRHLCHLPSDDKMPGLISHLVSNNVQVFNVAEIEGSQLCALHQHSCKTLCSEPRQTGSALRHGLCKAARSSRSSPRSSSGRHTTSSHLTSTPSADAMGAASRPLRCPRL